MTTEKTCSSCNDTQCAALHKRPGERDQDFADRQLLQARMCKIKHKILVLSGKGGVGKSTVAVNLATALAMTGKHVGVLDIDIHGPSVPKLLHLEEARVAGSETEIFPIEMDIDSGMLKVMSIALLLPKQDDAVMWRGPMKYGVIKQFLKDVEWGELDYLVIDAPPGTGDEPMAVTELIGQADGAIIVTTPQQVAVQDVRRCVVFCHHIQLPVLGVVENMQGFVCPKCGELVPIFGSNGGKEMAEQMHTPYLGAIPIEPAVVVAGDAGTPVVYSQPETETAKAFVRIARGLQQEPPLVDDVANGADMPLNSLAALTNTAEVGEA